MNREVISSRINGIALEVEKLKFFLRAANTLDIQRYPKGYESMTTEAALLAESVACKIRSLIYGTTSIRKQEYLQKAAETVSISVTYEKEILCLHLPRLLPKKTGKYSSLYLMEPVDAALDQYGVNHPLPKFRECVICFVHTLNMDTTDQRIFDYDNLQQKQLLDTIAVHVLTDDNGILCDVYNTTQIGLEDCTDVFIMEKNRFCMWLSERKTDKF